MRFPLPRTMASQLVIILVLVLVISQAVGIIAVIGERRIMARRTEAGAAMSRFVDEARDLQLPANARLPYLIYEGGHELSVLHVARVSQVDRMRDAIPDAGAARQLRHQLEDGGLSPIHVEAGRRKLDQTRRPPPRRGNQHDDLFRPKRPPDQTGPPPPGMEEIILSAEIEPGIWLNGSKTYYSALAVSSRIAVFTFAIALISSLIVWLFARRIARPLRDLAISADRLGRGRSTEPVPEQGPEDVRLAARAFNQMQDRLTRLLDTQRTMLRAVGHDLRTPLTSLRIRAESIPEENGRDQIISTLEDMRIMTEEILRWAKESSGLEDVSAVDIDTLLQSLTDDYADQGYAVSYAGTDKTIVAEVRRVALRRAVQNLIDNALKYGQRADVLLSSEPGYVVITVNDEGPGVPQDQIDEICKPFVRLEASRSKDTGGLGLGLAIVQSVVLAHGGILGFENRAAGGLSAILKIPSDRTKKKA